MMLEVISASFEIYLSITCALELMLEAATTHSHCQQACKQFGCGCCTLKGYIANRIVCRSCADHKKLKISSTKHTSADTHADAKRTRQSFHRRLVTTAGALRRVYPAAGHFQSCASCTATTCKSMPSHFKVDAWHEVMQLPRELQA